MTTVPLDVRKRFLAAAARTGAVCAHAALWVALAWVLKNDALEYALNGPVERMLNGHKASARWENPRWTGWGKIAADKVHLRYRRGEATATLNGFAVAFSTQGMDSVAWRSAHVVFYESKRKKNALKSSGKRPVRLPAAVANALPPRRSAQLRALWEKLHSLPPAGDVYDTRVFFDSPQIEGEFWFPYIRWGRRENFVHIEGRAQNECTRMAAVHVRDFAVPPMEFSFWAAGREEGFEILEGSRVRVGECDFFPRLRYAKDSLGFEVQIPEQPVARWFSALPEGAFDKLKKIRLTGEIGYRITGAMNVNRLDQIAVDAEVKAKKLRLDTGSVWWITEVNGEFSWQPFGARAFRRIDPDDPRYVELHETPEFLRQCLLLAEDPGFYRHKGFEPTMLREAAADNLATGRFRRGGSTLTMQLVKNLFLTPQKTIFRKLEEAGIVWCIENHDLISKDKILELYLNCAQWGPSSYGIREAADYWFGKKPLELTPEECVFLSLILPAPARALRLFDENGVLNDEAQTLFATMSLLLDRHGIIDAEVVELDVKKVCLEGRALADLIPVER